MTHEFKEILGVGVFYPAEMTEQEAAEYVKEQLSVKPDLNLVEMQIGLDGEDVLINPHYDTVRRTRRITGYLSNVDNFNDAKKAEETARVKHI